MIVKTLKIAVDEMGMYIWKRAEGQDRMTGRYGGEWGKAVGG